MKISFITYLLFFITTLTFSQSGKVTVINNNEGSKLQVNGKDFMINGMNWDYIPVGTNTLNADFWNKPEHIIKAGLEEEMTLLKQMNVNAIRQYAGVPAKWITYIYQNYGIYTMINHTFGRYGVSIDGAWIPATDYSDPKTKAYLLSEIKTFALEYKDTSGLLLYLIGNENNYGLFWAGSETEDFPDDKSQINFIGENRGKPMYKLMNEAAKIIKSIDAYHPVAICNGDTLFIDIIAEECQDIDIFGVNCYRGPSFTNIFDTVKNKLNKPIMFTEFGADAYNAKEQREDQKSQAYYALENWKEIYCNAAGLDGTDNSIGGFTFQFSDGWWKYGFNERKNADVHDTHASWVNQGYLIDFVEGKNNMNEEWFGICAKGPTDASGLYKLYPRATFYALKKAHHFNPYKKDISTNLLEEYFMNINLNDAILEAKNNSTSKDKKVKN